MSTEFPDAWRKIWKFLNHSFVLFILGLLMSIPIGIALGYYFYYLGMSNSVENAIKEGRLKGQREAYAEFEKNKAHLIEDRFSDYLETARKKSFSDGQKDGLAQGAIDEKNRNKLLENRYRADLETGRRLSYSQGEKDGFVRGKADGLAEGAKSGQMSEASVCRSARSAEKLWHLYSEAVIATARKAEAFGNRQKKIGPGDRIFAQISSLVSHARTLNEAYKQQASAFDSIIDEMLNAINKEDYGKLPNLVIALRQQLPSKEALFLAYNEKSLYMYEDLGKIAKEP